ncbi:porin [Paraburkholderia sp.]|jgi:predicted porin|uniref:porin n=1 Tax=Paraburkholderia sp. TaxID=1926495 RepID=UPI002F3E6D04
MKKSLLALTLSGAFVVSAHAQSSVTLYGVIDTGLVYTNNQGGHSNFQEASASTENTVYGLKGTEDLGGGLHAIFKLENGFNLNNGSQFNSGDAFGEQAYVGLQSDSFGTVLLGRQFDTFNDVMGPISSAGSSYGGNLSAHPFNNDNLAADSMSINNAVKFTSNTYSGLTVEGMYAFSNNAGGFSNNRAYGFGASYTHGPFNLAAGYLQLNNAGGGVSGTNPNGAVALNDGSADFVAQRQRIWGAGGNYTFGPATVGLLWTHSQIDNMASVFAGGAGFAPLGGGLRLDNYEVNARYSITPAWTVAGAYTFTDGAYGNGATSASPEWNQATLQTDYTLSKRTDLYLEGVYQHVRGAGTNPVLGDAFINTLSPSATGTQVAVTVGMRHQF